MIDDGSAPWARALGLFEARAALLAQDEEKSHEAWPALLALTERRLKSHGDFARFARVISELPEHPNRETNLNRAAPSVTAASPAPEVGQMLRQLGPWKKGPFELHGTLLDAEWRSDAKWERLLQMAKPFARRTVLDVGTGNGYFLLRAAGEGARFVLGLEPSVLFASQYLALRRLFGEHRAALIPATSEEFERARTPGTWRCFDTVLSMGVLYHRRSPLDHLGELCTFVKSGGQLVVETIVAQGPLGHTLVPEGRYAGMKNVWFLPSTETLMSWLIRLGMKNVQASAPVITTTEEQRSTSWSSGRSLADFLDPQDPSRTVEGHPAPVRAIITAEAP